MKSLKTKIPTVMMKSPLKLKNWSLLLLVLL